MKRLLNYDVLIIGGGFIGLSISIALYERQGNLKIVIAEKEEESFSTPVAEILA
jgi:L-2-hydroxyglutarate oxidase LhgO